MFDVRILYFGKLSPDGCSIAWARLWLLVLDMAFSQLVWFRSSFRKPEVDFEAAKLTKFYELKWQFSNLLSMNNNS